MDSRYLKNIDWMLLAATLGIVAFGCVMIYSATSGGIKASGYVERQIVWAVLGLVCAAVAASVTTTFLQRQAGTFYKITIVLLTSVFFLGHSAKGAQRWIGVGPVPIQPSEFAKLMLIVALAVFLVKRFDEIRTLKTFVLSFLYLAIPMGLIFKQPDLGTSLVLVAIWISMVFVMGTNIKNIALFVGVGLILGLIAWNVPGIMKDYQKNRVITFVDPTADPQGSGYHVTQSRIAIGSGQITGKGFLQGTQRKLNFIPEQHTDFIFTVVGEELGFAGACAIVFLYFIIIWRGLGIMSSSEDAVGRAIAAGVVGMFLFHIFVNIGMTVGIMPVTGVPLPFLSYGGSSLMSNLTAIGLLEGISMRRHKISF